MAAAIPRSSAHEEPPAVPPEVQKTVDALSGHWSLEGTGLEPGAKAPVAVKGTVDCKPVSLGAAVSCVTLADVGGFRVEAAMVVGYSPDERVVRWMEISSTGEYHDHRGPWKGDEIPFEPLAYTSSGVKMTEYFTLGFPAPDTMRWKWTTETPDGKSTYDLLATRVAAQGR
jgi:hypothetical protein